MSVIRDVLTEAEKQEFLEDQIKATQRRVSPSDSIMCPWCKGINKKDIPDCCGFYTEGLDEYGRKQLNSVIKQWKEMHLGSRRNIKCPYCESYNKKPSPKDGPESWTRPMVNPFCCDLMYDAALAISQRQAVVDQIAEKKRIEDHISDARAKAARN